MTAESGKEAICDCCGKREGLSVAIRWVEFRRVEVDDYYDVCPKCKVTKKGLDIILSLRKTNVG